MATDHGGLSSEHHSDAGEKIGAEGLCEACRNIFSSNQRSRQISTVKDQQTNNIVDKVAEVPSGRHHTYPNECEAAARNGCQICWIVFERSMGDKDRIVCRPPFTTYKVVKGYSSNTQKKYPADPWILEISFHSIDESSNHPIPFFKPEYVTKFALAPSGGKSHFNSPEHESQFCNERSSDHRLFMSQTNSVTTDSKESWRLVSQWLTACLTDHTRCKQTVEQVKFHPTRLIDVGGKDSETVTLSERDDIKDGLRYIALSHCWGNAPMIKLADPTLPFDDTENLVFLQDFMSGVPTSRLPKTFEDAVNVTRRLDIRYLWIDAICIVQNSPEDWRTESAQMHEVYGNAFCTLAATGSSDGGGGLFHERHPSPVNPVKVNPVWAEPPQESFFVIPLDFWKAHVSEATLNRRAWVLQERVLSPRVIHFGGNQILWECNSHDCCESFPSGLPYLIKYSETRFKGLDLEIYEGSSLDCARTDEIKDATGNHCATYSGIEQVPPQQKKSFNEPSFPIAQKEQLADSPCLSVLSEQATKDNIGEQGHSPPQPDSDRGPALFNQLDEEDERNDPELAGYFVWSRILEKYCTTKLTYGKDKLVAISGLAKRMESILDDEYISGLWKSILPSQLLWRIEDHEEVLTFFAVNDEGIEAATNNPLRSNASRLAQSRAPSWSWASIDGAIAPPYPYRDPGLIRLLGRARFETKDPSAYPLTAGLFVEGALHFGTLSYFAESRKWAVFI
jgi:Heterokaryon incompatibility protein (HET)